MLHNIRLLVYSSTKSFRSIFVMEIFSNLFHVFVTLDLFKSMHIKR